MNKRTLLPMSFGAWAGMALVLLGVVVPGPLLIAMLRGAPPEALRDDLYAGALLFRLGLILLGVAVFLIGVFWKRQHPDNLPSLRPNRGPETPDLLLGVLLLVSLILRLSHLDAGLWHDEIITYVNYARMPLGEIVSTYRDQNQHFLFSVLAKVTMEAFGDTASSLRFPAVLFGVGSIWALYLFAARITGKREALLGAALLAFSYHHVWFSQNARGYTGLLFWTLLASWAFMAALQESDSRRYWLLYACFCALGMYTHMTMAFVMLGHYIMYALRFLSSRRRQFRLSNHAGFLIGVGLTALLVFQLHALVLPQIVHHANEQSMVPAWKNPLWALFELTSALRISLSNGLLVLTALFVFLLGLWDLWKRHREVLYLLFLPSLITGAVVVGSGHHLWPRFFFFIFGFACMVVIRGIHCAVRLTANLVQITARRAVAFQTAACLSLVLLSALSIPRAYAPKQDFLGALRLVEREAAPSDRIVTLGLAGFTYRRFYNKDWPALETLGQLNELRAGASRVWVIYTFPPEVRAVYPEIMTALQNDFSTLQTFPGSVGSGAVFVCRSNPTRSAGLIPGGF